MKINNPECVFFLKNRRIYLFGHRGFSAAAPENTLPSFQALLDAGIPGVELDVHICRSGEIVIIHDDSLYRTTGCRASVQEMTYSQILSLDAGSWFGNSFKNTRIPLLDEVFDLLGKRVYYDIELKWRERKSGILEERVLNRIRDHGLGERCLISSFNPFCLRQTRRLDPAIPIALIYSNHRELPYIFRHGEASFLCNPDIVKAEYRQISTFSTNIYRRLLKRSIFAWTVDQPETAKKLVDSGVRGIISNNPGKIKSALGSVILTSVD